MAFASPRHLRQQIAEQHLNGTHYLIVGRGDMRQVGAVVQAFQIAQSKQMLNPIQK